MEESDKLWHCIHPQFIEDQINQQLKRLQVDYIDGYLLHNPEYYLGWAEKNNVSKSDAREIYYQRIRNAFEYLEKKADEGKILYYGISSNTFVSRSEEYDFTSFERLIDIANSISVSNRFRVIQFPFNLFEAGAVINKNQINNTETILQLALKASIKVLVNRPLNAITSKGLVRLADFKWDEFHEKDFIKQMKLVSLMEKELINEKALEKISDEDKKKLTEYLTFGKLIEENWKFFGSIENYNDTISLLITPRIDFLINYFSNNIHDENIKNFFQKYLKECFGLFDLTGNYYKMKAEKRSRIIHSLINKNLDSKFHGLTLSQKTVLILKSVAGVSCVLVGARSLKYANDILAVLDMEKISNAEEIIKTVSFEVETV